MEVNAVAVVGTGVIGTGLVQALAETGHRVVALDLSDAILEKSRDAVASNLRLHRLFRKTPGRATGETLANITWTTEPAALADVSFVIENVTEKWDVKRELYATIDAVCAKDAVLAANTSAIAIARLAALTSAPARVIGMHLSK
jgi:3-hydroxybutyryl-CoA dehydrogenase